MASTLSSVIGALRANLSLDATQFDKGSKQAQSGLKSLHSSFQKVMPSMAKLAAGMTAAFTAATAGIIAGSAALASQAKEIKQSADALGMTTESFQVMTGAAAKFGIEGDKIRDVVKDLNDRFGDFMLTGAGPLVDFMEQIATPQSVSVEELVKLPPEERLIRMQSLMDSAGASLEQQTFLWEAIASDATYLMPLLADGGEHLRRIKDEMLATGRILSEDVIANLTTFSSNLSGIRGIMAGWGNILVSQFAPQLADISTRILTFLTHSQSIRDAFAATGQAIGGVLTFLADNFDRIISYASTAVIGITAYAGVMGVAAIATGGLSAALGLLRTAIVGTGVGVLVIAAGEAVHWFREWVSSIGGVNNALTVAGVTWRGIVDIFNTSISAISDLFKGAGKLIAAAFQSAFAMIMTGYGTMIGTIESGLNVIIDAVNALGGNLQRLSSGDALKDLGQDAMNAARDNFAEAGDLAQGAADRMGAIDWSKPFTDAQAAAAAYRSEAEQAALVTPPVIPNPMANMPAGGAGITPVDTSGGGGKKEKAKESEYSKMVKSLTADLEKYKATIGMTRLEEKIWSDQRKAEVSADSAGGKAIATLNTQIDALERQRTVADNLKTSMADMFGSIISGSMSAGDAIKNLANTMLTNLGNAFLSSAMGGLGGMLGGSGGGGSFSSLISAAFGGGFANGTNGYHGKAGWQIVGERGIEAVSMGAGTKVLNNKDTMSMLSGGGSAGVLRLEVGYSQDAEVRVLESSKQHNVKLVQQGFGQYDRNLPNRIKHINNDPRAR